MARILVVYASSHGQTRKIAGAIAARLRRPGQIVDLADADTRPPPPQDYDVVVVGSRVEMGRHAPSIATYVALHREALVTMPTAFFSVSMSATKPGAGPDPNRYMASFFDKAGWHPQLRAAFAGGLPYRQYNWWLRFWMRVMSRQQGHTTDTSRDHEMTDWAQVERFADEVAAAGAGAGRGCGRRTDACGPSSPDAST